MLARDLDHTHIAEVTRPFKQNGHLCKSHSSCTQATRAFLGYIKAVQQKEPDSFVLWYVSRYIGAN